MQFTITSAALYMSLISSLDEICPQFIILSVSLFSSHPEPMKTMHILSVRREEKYSKVSRLISKNHLLAGAKITCLFSILNFFLKEEFSGRKNLVSMPLCIVKHLAYLNTVRWASSVIHCDTPTATKLVMAPNSDFLSSRILDDASHMSAGVSSYRLGQLPHTFSHLVQPALV